jgi:hypothetical protein
VADAIENYQRNRYAIPKGNLDYMKNIGWDPKGLDTRN